MKVYFYFVFFLSFGWPLNLFCQQETFLKSHEQDFNARILAEFRNFYDYLSLISATDQAPDEIRKKGIQKCLLLFSDHAIVEWESLNDNRSTSSFSLDEFLWEQFHTGNELPIICNFEVVDTLYDNELTVGKISEKNEYTGQIVFNISICNLKEPINPDKNKNSRSPCDCKSTTKYQASTIVVAHQRGSIKGEFWITRFKEVSLKKIN